jgi:hypothetical protein
VMARAAESGGEQLELHGGHPASHHLDGLFNLSYGS